MSSSLAPHPVTKAVHTSGSLCPSLLIFPSCNIVTYGDGICYHTDSPPQPGQWRVSSEHEYKAINPHPPPPSTTAQELKTQQQQNSLKVVVAINISCGHGHGQVHRTVSSTGLRPVNSQLTSHSFLQRSGSLARGLTCLSASWHSAKYLPDMSRTSSAITQYSVV